MSQFRTMAGLVARAGADARGDAAWPSAYNRPAYSAGTLAWTGPGGGGANDGSPVYQTRALTNRPTELTTTANGQVIEGLDISARINVRHSDVIIRQCRITNPDYYSIYLDSGSPTGLIVEDCLLDGGGGIQITGIQPEATGTGLIVRRNNILGYENGMFVASGMEIRDNWIHDLSSGGAAHTDGIQGTGGFTSLVIDHNAIDSVDTSCIIMQNEYSGFSGLVVNNNKLTGNVAACLYVRGDKSAGVVGAFTVTNNRMKTSNGAGSYFSIESVAGPITWSGNVDDDTGAPIASP